MRFSLLSLLPAIGMLASLGQADDSCNEGGDKAPFAPSTLGGVPFSKPDDRLTYCDLKWRAGDQIVGIQAWSLKFHVKAVRFKFANAGWTSVHGDIPDEKPWATQQTEWNAGDEVEVHIVNNKPDDKKPMDGIGRIRITKKGQDIFNVGGSSGKMQSSEIEGINSGAGIILGAKVRTTGWLTSIEFKMLKSKIVKTELVDLKFTENIDEWNKKSKGIDNANLDDVYFVNPNKKGGSNLTYTFTQTVKRDSTKTISTTYTNSYGYGLDITLSGEVEVPFLAKVKVDVKNSFTYKHDKADTHEWTKSEGVDLSYSLGSVVSSPLQPQKAAHCQAWAIKGVFASKYNGVVKATLQDGSTYSYAVNGGVTSVSWAKANTQCEEIDLAKVPSSGKIANGKAARRAVEFIG